MGNVVISLRVYDSDVAHRVLNLTPEISDEEKKELKEFIIKMLQQQGNPGVMETLVWGIRSLFKLWQEAGKDEEQFELMVSKIYREGVEKRGRVY